MKLASLISNIAGLSFLDNLALQLVEGLLGMLTDTEPLFDGILFNNLTQFVPPLVEISKLYL